MKATSTVTKKKERRSNKNSHRHKENHKTQRTQVMIFRGKQCYIFFFKCCMKCCMEYELMGEDIKAI